MGTSIAIINRGSNIILFQNDFILYFFLNLMKNAKKEDDYPGAKTKTNSPFQEIWLKTKSWNLPQ